MLLHVVKESAWERDVEHVVVGPVAVVAVHRFAKALGRKRQASLSSERLAVVAVRIAQNPYTWATVSLDPSCDNQMGHQLITTGHSHHAEGSKPKSSGWKLV